MSDGMNLQRGDGVGIGMGVDFNVSWVGRDAEAGSLRRNTDLAWTLQHHVECIASKY
jgi:hypothetical protein